MNYDEYGRLFVTQEDLVDLLYKNPNLQIENFLVTDPNSYNDAVSTLFTEFPKLPKYTALNNDLDQFDKQNQNNWFMPDSYKQLDIAQWLLDQCKNQEELQRVASELLLFEERNLFDLLRFLKYLVDTMKTNNIVWGVGRGSSVASFVLYLMGVHKINSMYYDLDIKEFLK